MYKLSIKAWVIIGFSISVVGVFLNVYSGTVLNERSREVDSEIAAIKESLRVQAAEISHAEIQDNLATLLHYVAQVQDDDELAVETNGAAIDIMFSHIIRTYAAANDIPMSDVVKADVIEKTSQLKFAEKLREAVKAEEEGDEEQAEKLQKEAEGLQAATGRMDSEFGKKLAGIFPDMSGESALATKGLNDIYLELLPAYKKVNDQFLRSFAEKEARIQRLLARQASLAWWGNFLNYLGVSLQLLGMFCVMNKDMGDSL